MFTAAASKWYAPAPPMPPPGQENGEDENTDNSNNGGQMPASRRPRRHPIGAVEEFIQFKPTSATPKKKVKAQYDDKKNDNKIPWQRRRNCLGWAMMRTCDEDGKPNNDERICAFCKKKGATHYCAQCHIYLHDRSKHHGITGSDAPPPYLFICIETNSPASRKFMYGINTCAHIWHAEARKKLTEALSPLSTGELVEPGLVTSSTADAIAASSSHSSVSANAASQSSAAAAAASTALPVASRRASGTSRRAQSRERFGTPPTAQRPRTLDHDLARADT